MEDNSDSSDKLIHCRSKKIKTIDAIGTLRIGETTARHIPQEIIEEILVRLPVKSLLRFKSVAKSWLALISSPKFIKTHLTYSTNLDQTLSSYRLMLSISYDHYEYNESNCLNSFVLRDFWTGVVDSADRPNDQTKHRFEIHSSCNGLLCVALYYRCGLKDDVFLWNPCLRMSKKLPPPLCAAEGSEISMARYCIAYDERNDDYKVVALLSLRSPLQSKVEIYSLKNDSWKRIEDFKGDRYRQTFMVYASGKINFAQYCKRDYLSIVSLDLENEVYGTVELILKIEQKKDYYSLSVGALNGCICALHGHAQDRADVWILKEYGVKESWTKLVSIPYVDRPPSVYNHYQYHLLFIWNGKYLLGHQSHLVVYDPEDSSFVHHSFINGNMDYIGSRWIYVESLVPLPEMKSFAPLPESLGL